LRLIACIFSSILGSSFSIPDFTLLWSNIISWQPQGSENTQGMKVG
jgi:hypothetical protein